MRLSGRLTPCALASSILALSIPVFSQTAEMSEAVKVDWSKTVILSRSTPTLQVVVNPMLLHGAKLHGAKLHGAKLHDGAFTALHGLGADYVENDVMSQLRVRAGKEQEYDHAHQHVWPELLAELESFGVSDYSIFRRGQDLFLYLRVPHRDELVSRLHASEVNQRWQEKMAPLFEPSPALQHGETLALMEEVFFLPGSLGRDKA